MNNNQTVLAKVTALLYSIVVLLLLSAAIGVIIAFGVRVYSWVVNI